MPTLRYVTLLLVALALFVGCASAKSSGTADKPAAQSGAAATSSESSSTGKGGSQRVQAPDDQAFACTGRLSGGASSPPGQLTAVRLGRHSGYDRITFQFEGSSGVPAYKLVPQSSASFVQDASELPLSLDGSAGLGIVFPGSSGVDLGVTPVRQTYTGSRDIKAGLPFVRELVQLGDFERVLSWGAALWSPACLRITELSNPTQLAIDVKSAPSAVGPYATREAAEQFVRTQGEPGSTLTPISPQTTWQPAATLHVIHATFEGSASWAGDWYFFFVHGNLVGKQYFTRSAFATAVDDMSFSVSYDVFRQGDPHCCPSGGQASVRLQWNGSQLTPLDPMPGPVMG